VKKTRRVALILETARPYQRKIIRGVAAYARQSSAWSLYAEEDPLDKLPDLRAWHGQGIITTFSERRYAETVRGLDIPVVGIEGGYCWYEPECGIPYFSTDNEAVARMAAEHLLGQGYSRLAYCGLPRNRYNVWSEQRARAFKQRAREAGVPCSSYVGRHLSTRKWPELQAGLCRWLRSLRKPVGVTRMTTNSPRSASICRENHPNRWPEENAASPERVGDCGVK